MKRLALTDAETVDVLLEARLISDNCIRVWDIAEPDLSIAIGWLKSKRLGWGDGADCNKIVLR
jgi:hypothetical protein